MKLRVLDLFSGIGGFSLGLERTGGFKTVAFCEIDPFCRAVLRKHWPDIPCADDILTREFIEGEADVIVGGFPCQDISSAGGRAGLAGASSGLWRELLRAIRVVRPLHAIVENVAALLGRGMGDVLGDMAEIGYDAEWHCIPASAVGAPHRRDRVWIVAHSGSQQHEGSRAPISGALATELSRAATNAQSGRRESKQQNSYRERQGALERGKRPRSSAGSGSALGDSAERTKERGRTSAGMASAVCESNSERKLQSQGSEPHEWGRIGNSSWWGAEPNVGRVADGVPARVDRLRALGNAVVPQIPELIGRAVLDSLL